MDSQPEVWIFHGVNGRFSSGVFNSRHLAEQFIAKHLLTGTLTKYPLNVGVYDWAVQNGYFIAAKPQHDTPEFIQAFTTASQEHYHYENGNPD